MIRKRIAGLWRRRARDTGRVYWTAKLSDGTALTLYENENRAKGQPHLLLYLYVEGEGVQPWWLRGAEQ